MEHVRVTNNKIFPGSITEIFDKLMKFIDHVKTKENIGIKLSLEWEHARLLTLKCQEEPGEQKETSHLTQDIIIVTEPEFTTCIMSSDFDYEQNPCLPTLCINEDSPKEKSNLPQVIMNDTKMELTAKIVSYDHKQRNCLSKLSGKAGAPISPRPLLYTGMPVHNLAFSYLTLFRIPRVSDVVHHYQFEEQRTRIKAMLLLENKHDSYEVDIKEKGSFHTP